jgi:hypothetical protein
MTKNASRQLQARDADGLTLMQRRALQALALTDDWRDACTEAQVSPNSVMHWLSNNEAFRAAYNDILRPNISIIRDMMETTALKATGMYDEAVTAVKMVELEIVCPSCAHKFSLTNPQPDWSTRLRAGDTAMRVAKVLKDVKEIEGTITHLNMEESLALASARYAIRRGQTPTIPPQMMAKLRSYLPEEAPNEASSGPIVDARVDGIRPVDGDLGDPVSER